MCDPASTGPDGVENLPDYSTPEGQCALRLAEDMILELREELARDPAARKIALYERSLGLAVIPVLVRRGAYGLWHRVRTRRPGGL